MLHTYYLDAQHNAVCFDCAQDTLIHLTKQRNTTGKTITCSCGQEIPFVGQVYTIRPDFHTLLAELSTARA
jgi:hypothetical protein